MSKRYQVLVFDCINTVLLPDVSGLPTLDLEGRSVPSTAPLLTDHLAPRFPHLRPEAVHHALRGAWRWAESQRGERLAEVPARERFQRFFAELGLEDVNGPEVEAALAVHMAAVTGTFVLPDAHRDLLTRLRDAYSLALFSNFDHRPALLERLAEHGIAERFDPLIISDGLGFRKPGREAFARMLAQLGAGPEAVLMIGDSLEDDVAGSQAAGIDVAWVNPKGAPPPENPPTYELASLPALAEVLHP